MSFQDLGIRADFIKALTEMNIIDPSDIQKKMIPLLLGGESDVIGQAQTGTGKTAAFGLPLLEQIDCNVSEIQGLILCPTRELGKQVAKQLFRYTKYSEKIFTEAVYGGEHIDKQIKALARTTHIVVATPGRLIDLVNKKALDLSNVKTVILDEADEMLSMGFKKELDEILSFLPKAENKWLFSATIP
ncbi:MAG TPA: DEAD/DEAH box helicase, partial [Crocinitomicaceae bacterium]|nr:DEAD/DEAH box helicase [Crocinitomicaceae bacterium]